MTKELAFYWTRGEDPVGVPYDGELQLWTTMQVGEWEVRHRFISQKGHPVVAEVRVFSPEERKRLLFNRNLSEEERANLPETQLPEGGITRRLLHSIPAPTITAQLREELARLLKEHGPEALSGSGPIPSFGFDEGSLAAPKRGRKTDLVRYARMCESYVEAVDSGVNDPVEVVRAKFKETRKKTIAEALSRCRRPPLELLTKSLPGKAGGSLTEKAKQILQEAERKG